jgi:hypothetical protein
MRLVGALLVAATLVGCSSTREVGRAPALEPPPAGEIGLTREQALLVARSDDSEQAIRVLDRQRFAFVLDGPTLGWFEREGATPAALDYLRKRAKVNWEGLRGDVDTEAPAAEYIDPRRGFDDWAGFGRRSSFSDGERSRDPFAR